MLNDLDFSWLNETAKKPQKPIENELEVSFSSNENERVESLSEDKNKSEEFDWLLKEFDLIEKEQSKKQPLDDSKQSLDDLFKEIEEEKKQPVSKKSIKKKYEKKLAELQGDLVKLQNWVKAKGLRVVVLFEGRDAAGKGGTIKRITQCLNARICRVEALDKPTEKEQSQWYFQRYVAKLPSAGEIVLFDRSWYNRAGVEKVMGFCTAKQHKEFLKACPKFEKMIIQSGIILIKYWFEISPEEQEKRLNARLDEPAKRWKIGSIDLVALDKFSAYTKARDIMFEHTNIKQSPWHIVRANDKKTARLSCISHLLKQIDYKDLPEKELNLLPLIVDSSYQSSKKLSKLYVPDFPLD